MTNPTRCDIISPLSRTTPTTWGYSSVGRALEWHSRGQGFDSPYLHQQKALHLQCLFCCVEMRGMRSFAQDAGNVPCGRFAASPASGLHLAADTERSEARRGSDSPYLHQQKAGSHKEVCPMHGRGEHPSKLGGSPTGDRRSPLRINKFDTQKTNNKPRQIFNGLSGFITLYWIN